MAHRILMISSDAREVSPIEQFFTRRGYVVDFTSELLVAEALLCCTHYSLVVLDFGDAPETERLELVAFAHEQSAVTRVALVVDARRAHESWLPRFSDIDALLHEPVGVRALQALEDRFLGAPAMDASTVGMAS
jgi:DNA-binding response OmpR family regulator